MNFNDNKYPSIWIYPALFAFLMIIGVSSQAQRHSTRGMNSDGDVLSGVDHGSGGGGASSGSWAIALNGGYEVPQGDLKEIYKGSPTFGATVSKRLKSFLFSAGIDYRAYKPKQSSVSYPSDLGTTATATYSNFTGVGLYVGAAYMVSAGPANIYAGLNAGSIISKSDTEISDGGFFNLTVSSATNITYLGPKLGVNFPVSNNFSVGLEGRYSISIAEANYDLTNGGTTTKGFKSYAGNLFLVYSF